MNAHAIGGQTSESAPMTNTLVVAATRNIFSGDKVPVDSFRLPDGAISEGFY